MRDMRNDKINIRNLLFPLISVLFIILGLVVPTMSLGQSTETQTSTNISADPILPTQEIEANLRTDYKIPSQAGIADTKQKAMKSDMYLIKEKEIGKEKAERELDEKLKADLDYMIEENKKGNTTIQIMKIGDHSAYYSNWTFVRNSYGQCTTIKVDPMNVFFYNRGAWNDAAVHLYYHGWSPNVYLATDQCAWTSSYPPSYNQAVSQLRPQRTQLVQGSLIDRRHIRIWEGVYSSGGEGYWSAGSVHQEMWAPGYNTHCLYRATGGPGDSFDVAEEYVSQSLSYLGPHWYFADRGSNYGFYPSCGHWAYNDGVSIGINVR